MDRIEVTRTYLELRQRPPANSDVSWPDGVTLTHEAHCSVALARALYAAVGRAYHWYDRDSWTDQRLAAHLANPGVAVWVLRDSGRPIGYFELAWGPDAGVEGVEIAYFGLVAAAHGRGLGKKLLEGAIRAAFATATERVWLHTCTLDHAAALPNYRARGFVPFKTERYAIARPGTT